ncbi:MAG TPA: lysylphosphatidylglycerol synthase transmembrane domain-containing protein, partial [Candidatus Kapabacteria bacterium]|nr:lysylphosphatidylglycerol synthase transmembrane domain-containing protein [Candidatus Kapabacteria bacterium]
MNKIFKEIIKWVLVVAIVVGSIYSVVKDIDFYKLWIILRTADYLWVIISIPIILLSHWVRAVRWKILLKPILDAKSTWNLFSAVMVGYAVNNILPRGGELVRPFVYARREVVSRSAVFATIIIERFLDVLFLLILFAVVFFFSRDIIS